MKRFFALAIAGLLLIGCNNNKTNSAATSDKKSERSASTGENVISFKVNGDEVQTSGWNIRLFKWSNQSDVWMNITSDMHKERRTINVNLNGSRPGTYGFTDGGVIMESSHGSYHPNFNESSNSFSFVSGSFVLRDVDTVRHIVNATFSVTARNTKGETVNITDGKIINGTLKPGVISL